MFSEEKRLFANREDATSIISGEGSVGERMIIYHRCPGKYEFMFVFLA